MQREGGEGDTSEDNVDIVSITEKRRRAGSIDVETKIRASDATGANQLATGASQLASTLGAGDTLKRKINAELKKQSLEEATAMTASAKVFLSEAGCGSGLSATWALLLAANVVSLHGAGSAPRQAQVLLLDGRIDRNAFGSIPASRIDRNTFLPTGMHSCGRIDRLVV